MSKPLDRGDIARLEADLSAREGVFYDQDPLSGKVEFPETLLRRLLRQLWSDFEELESLREQLERLEGEYDSGWEDGYQSGHNDGMAEAGGL